VFYNTTKGLRNKDFDGVFIWGEDGEGGFAK
jgi:hypothetical protein